MFALYIILGWLLLGGVSLIVFYWRKEMKMTSSTKGLVISATTQEIRDQSGRRDETTLRVRYTISGQDYEISHTLRGKIADRFPAGRSVPVRYNPSDPKMARIPTE